MHMTAVNAAFYRRWIFANGWAEAAGLGTTFALGRLLAPLHEGVTGVLAIVGTAVIAVILGTLLEGVLVGFAQETVLRRRLFRLRLRAWIWATAIGAGLAWALGMIPSTVIALLSQDSTAASASVEPPVAFQYGLAAVLGLVAGPVLGLAQWVVLRRLVQRAGLWLWANAVAWAVGMPLIFLGMDLVPWNGHPAAMTLAIYAVCGATGLVVGAIHGQFLMNLLRQSPSPNSLA
jgi:hypothetical protein